MWPMLRSPTVPGCLLLLLASFPVGTWAASAQDFGRSTPEGYGHVSYRFTQHQPGLPRDGEGDFWISWDQSHNWRLRLRGITDSVDFGRSTVTVFLESKTKQMSARVEVPKLNLNLCTKYQFPDLSLPDNMKRVEVLKQLRSKVSLWENQQHGRQHGLMRASRIQWDAEHELNFQLSQDTGSILGLQLEDGPNVVKQIEFNSPPEYAAAIPEEEKRLYEDMDGHLIDDCHWPDASSQPEVASVDLTPPHQRSSALYDMMLMLASDDPLRDWTEQYLMLSSMLLPADIAVEVQQRRNEPASLPEMAQTRYTHAKYTFELNRAIAKRTGRGDIWMSWEGTKPMIRLRGVAESPKFGKGVITIFLDAKTKVMYARVELTDLRSVQCTKYPFPDLTTEKNQLRLNTLKGRKAKVLSWEGREDRNLENGRKVSLLQWTKRYKLGFVTHEAQPGQIMGVHLTDGNRLVKKVEFVDPADHSTDVPLAKQTLFQPLEDCKWPDEMPHEMATVDLRGPHSKSSVLNDLMLVLASDNPKTDWTEQFLLLSSLLLPGDISVMLEDPDPPNIEGLHHLAFDYSASTAGHAGRVRRSQGSIWVNMEQRKFRLRGSAKNTKVGDLSIDLLVHGGGDDPKIFAHVRLQDEDEHQCVVYPYPTLSEDPRRELEDAAGSKLRFFSISEIDGEDCAIFVGPLARGRWIHIWVDLEAEHPNAFLRSEIHRNQKVLRATKVEQWRTGDEVEVEVEPKAEWNCRERDLSGRLASLDIRSMHKNSIQLEDALFSLHQLGPDFAVREILGLTGDVAIIVKVPEPPELHGLTTATFDFRVSPDSANGNLGGINGNFAVDKASGKVRLTAETPGPQGTKIILALDSGEALAVRTETGSSADWRCMKLNLKGRAPQLTDAPRVGTGFFEGVESLYGDECNHFSFDAEGADARSLDLWYSEENDALCQIDLLTARTGPKQLTRLEIRSFTDMFLPQVETFAFFDKTQESWDCGSAEDAMRPWLSLEGSSDVGLLQSPDETVSSLGHVAEVLGMIGIMPSQAMETLLSTSIGSPGPTASSGAQAAGKKSGAGLTLVPKTPAPSCCATEGLGANPTGLASPVVVRQDGEYRCMGSDVLSEQEWMSHLSDRLQTSGDRAVGLCLKEGYFEREIPPDATVHPEWINDDVMSPLLKQFTFFFTSTFPLKGFPAGRVSAGQKFTGETYRHRHKGDGEVRVDLERRRLYVMSRAQDFSKGVQTVKSEIIYRGDLDMLVARSRYTAGKQEYEQCWRIHTGKVLPAPSPGATRNPFHRGRLNGKGFRVPGSSSKELAQRYSFFPDPQTRVALYVNDKRELAHIMVDDIARDVATSIATDGWLTAPIEDKWFEVHEDWKCNEHELDDGDLEQLAGWDLLQIFLPTDENRPPPR